MADIRAYRVEIGDIFSVSAETFFTNSMLWSSNYQIQSTYIQKFPRKIPLFKKKVTMVKIMYVGQ